MKHEQGPAQELRASSPDEDWFIGHAAVQGPQVELRTTIIDGFSVETNLPEGVNPLEPLDSVSETGQPGDRADPDHPFRRPLLPSALDDLPAGTFIISHPEHPDMGFDREITVIDDPDGKRINFISDGIFINGSTKLMTALGYKFARSNGIQKVEFVPTPLTLKHKAAELGVDIEFFPEHGLIDSENYVRAFAEGRYPVSTGSARYNVHDMQDDHLTAMVLGGEPLKIALRDAATEALNSGSDLDDQAGGIDEFTAYLRGTVSPTMNEMPMPYSVKTLEIAGKRIGLTSDQVHTILETARTNAQTFGMQVNQ